jgi:hypothetical protein
MEKDKRNLQAQCVGKTIHTLILGKLLKFLTKKGR